MNKPRRHIAPKSLPKLKITSEKDGSSVRQFRFELFQGFQNIFYIIFHRRVILLVKSPRDGANDLGDERKELKSVWNYTASPENMFELFAWLHKYTLPLAHGYLMEISAEYRNTWCGYEVTTMILLRDLKGSHAT
jgi:hypothetical protein